MSLTVCLGTCSLSKARESAYLWMFLNWALGLKSVGCSVVWLTSFPDGEPESEIKSSLQLLRTNLARFGLDGAIAICSKSGNAPKARLDGVLDLGAAAESDIFINIAYHHPTIVARFRRTVFVDIDPGLTQLWISRSELFLPNHDFYFTYGENVGSSNCIPSCGRNWIYTPPPVYLPRWPVVGAEPFAAYTTISSWWGDREYLSVGSALVDNSKRQSILCYVDLPSKTDAVLELALPLTDSEEDMADRQLLEGKGWRLRSAGQICQTPDSVQSYIQNSRGELSFMKRGYTLLETAWTSERTINYLATGKPAIVSNTGRSGFLPEDEGLLRFGNADEAARRLASVEANYEYHCKAARKLAEEHFDADRVVTKMLAHVAG